CTKKSPLVFVASRSSPASSGRERIGFQTAWPCCRVQSGAERSIGGSDGSVRQPGQIMLAATSNKAAIPEPARDASGVSPELRMWKLPSSARQRVETRGAERWASGIGFLPAERSIQSASGVLNFLKNIRQAGRLRRKTNSCARADAETIP